MFFSRRRRSSNTHARLDTDLTLRWRSEHACHSDRVRLCGIDPATLPLSDAHRGLAHDEPLTRELAPGTLVPAWREAHVVERARHPLVAGVRDRTLRAGRYYPATVIDAPPPRPGAETFYLLDIEGDVLTVDYNHPLAPYGTLLEIRAWEPPTPPIAEQPRLLTGPGMQAPMEAHGLQADHATARVDERPDALFYERVRRVAHLDALATAQVAELYARFVRPGMRVLDLMASWDSHLPSHGDLEVIGLGMNEAELAANTALTHRLVHDLNANPRLPLPAAHFDAAVCTVSIEYLTRPVDVLREVGRVLTPGAPLVIVFSDRWFPPKVTRVWTELHPFERMGLVAYWLRACGWFDELSTESVRGHRRPADDPHAGERASADPLFAVWGHVEA